MTGPVTSPRQDTPTEDASSQDGPTEDTPTEDTPTEDTPTEDTPTEDTPTEDGPSGDDRTTTAPGSIGRPLCPVCWTSFPPTGRQRFCSDNCRKTAWARTHRQPAPPAPPVPPPGRRREATVYACPSCEVRLYGEQWCPDCNQPCTRVGLCPHCQEPVALTDLLDTPQHTPEQPLRG